MSFGKYLRAAIARPWNLLLLTAGGAAAYFSGAPEYVLPVLAVGETGYLLFATQSDAFRRFVDTRAAAKSPDDVAYEERRTVDRMIAALPYEYQTKFRALKKHCQDLAMTSNALPDRDRATGTLEDDQTADLDRLLWIYLKLLTTHHALTKFLETTHSERLEEDIRRLERRLKDDATRNDDATESDPDDLVKRRAALTENLVASRERLSNVERSRANLALTRDELESLETKIRTLSESTVNRHDSRTFAEETRAIVAGMRDTERTIGELREVDGLIERTTPPKMLEKN